MVTTQNTYKLVSVKDGTLEAYELFSRHYSFSHTKTATTWFIDFWRKLDPNMVMSRRQVVGPGEKLLLTLKPFNNALVTFRKMKYDKSGEKGVCCTIFRNESDVLSSQILLSAEKMVRKRWPLEKRMYTFVHSGKIKSVNPGCCFKKAGWVYTGKKTSRGLMIFEKYLKDNNQ